MFPTVQKKHEQCALSENELLRLSYIQTNKNLLSYFKFYQTASKFKHNPLLHSVEQEHLMANIFIKKGIMRKISYEYRVYDSVDGKSLSWDRYISRIDRNRSYATKGFNWEIIEKYNYVSSSKKSEGA